MTFPLDQSMTFFPFTLSGYRKGRQLERFFKYIEELLSFSMDVKTDLICFLYEVKKTFLKEAPQLISGGALSQCASLLRCQH
jgi:hypothetical protein